MPLLKGLVVAIKLLITQSYAAGKRAKLKPGPGKPLQSPLDFFTHFKWDHCFVWPRSHPRLGQSPVHSHGAG